MPSAVKLNALNALVNTLGDLPSHGIFNLISSCSPGMSLHFAVLRTLRYQVSFTRNRPFTPTLAFTICDSASQTIVEPALTMR